MTETNEPIIETPELEQLRAQVAELSDKYLRARAEVENTKRRAAIDCDTAARIRAVSVAENFLPLVDAIGAALNLSPDDSGVKAMAVVADAALAKIGIERIESVGQKLNPALHNAVSVAEPSPQSDAEALPISGTIIEELQTGYTFGEAVLRTAMVIVAK